MEFIDLCLKAVDRRR